MGGVGNSLPATFVLSLHSLNSWKGCVLSAAFSLSFFVVVMLFVVEIITDFIRDDISEINCACNPTRVNKFHM